MPPSKNKSKTSASQIVTLHRAGWVLDAPTVFELRVDRNGALAVDQSGAIVGRGPFTALKKKYPKAKVVDHGADCVMTPGFVDCHVHAPQMEMMAAAGYSLLEWLNNYTFPTEAKYSNKKYATARWKEFCDGLLRCGTTFAAVYATSHTPATRALLEAMDTAGLRGHVGKVLMDRNAPENLLQDADSALSEIEELILKWKKTDRVRVSAALRFAPTSTHELMRGTGELLKKYPDLVLQTHLAETPDEVKWVAELYPKSKNYSDVYAGYGLLGPTTVLGHCIYLTDDEIELNRRARTKLVHCPTSNLFLGSGLFPYKKLQERGLAVAMGSDVGAGWDLSMQSTARTAYEAQALQKYFMKPAELLYLSTRAGAEALGRGSDVGTLEEGYQADFVVHDLRARGLVAARAERSESPDDLLSALLFLGGEVTLKATYVGGICRYKKSRA